MDECLVLLFISGDGTLWNADKLLENEVNASDYYGKYWKKDVITKMENAKKQSWENSESVN
jgi:hypothetical protein